MNPTRAKILDHFMAIVEAREKLIAPDVPLDPIVLAEVETLHATIATISKIPDDTPDLTRDLIRAVAASLPPPRVIYDRSGVSPYLSRYYLVGAPTMPDGSAPFDSKGDPREGLQEPDRPFAVFLHCFHRGDEDAELHNHPWEVSASLVLYGGYIEERRTDAPLRGGSVMRTITPGMVNIIRANDFHRVTLLKDEAWSLFVAGKRAQGWGFWNRDTGAYSPWREFISARRDRTAFVMDEARRNGALS